jgi:hypothetical protein
VGGRRALVAGLTSLTFIVAASQIGMELGDLSEATGAAMIAANSLSVLIYPVVALTILRGTEHTRALPPTAVTMQSERPWSAEQ